MLLRKRKRAPMGCRDEAKREFPRHRKFVRSLECAVSLSMSDAYWHWPCQGPTEVSHIRTAATAGTGLKPADWHAVSMCHYHHAEYHRIGAASWEQKYALDLASIAADLARRSPDLSMRDYMKEHGE